MAGSFNGFGTTFYGERDYRADGSYITTEWVIAAGVPIFPLKSFRLIPTKNNVYMVVYASRGYVILEEMPCHRRQVSYTYAFVAAGLGWFFLVVSCADHFEGRFQSFPPNIQTLLVLAVVAIAFLPVVALWLFRRRARRSVIFSPEALNETMRRVNGVQSQTVVAPPPPPAIPPPLPPNTSKANEVA
jgi:hypothetical protein